jgi:hypothetical protein
MNLVHQGGPGMKIHIIRPGDTVSKIVQKYNIPLERLQEANPHITNLDKLEVGEKVCIPTGKIPVAPKGETLEEILPTKNDERSDREEVDDEETEMSNEFLEKEQYQSHGTDYSRSPLNRPDSYYTNWMNETYQTYNDWESSSVFGSSSDYFGQTAFDETFSFPDPYDPNVNVQYAPPFVWPSASPIPYPNYAPFIGYHPFPPYGMAPMIPPHVHAFQNGMENQDWIDYLKESSSREA